MTGSNTERPAEGKPHGSPHEDAPEPPAAAGPRPSPAVGPRPVRGFGRRVRPPDPPAAEPPAPAGTAPANPEPPPAGPVAPGISARPVAPAEPAPSEPAPAGVQPDPSRLNDEAYLAAEAVRLGIRVGDDTTGPGLEGDAKLLAEARRLGLRTSSESAANWQEPFDEEMERTAILLGIRSEDSPRTPTASPRKISKALPWIVLVVLLMAGFAVTTLFMDTIIGFLAAGVG